MLHFLALFGFHEGIEGHLLGIVFDLGEWGIEGELRHLLVVWVEIHDILVDEVGLLDDGFLLLAFGFAHHLDLLLHLEEIHELFHVGLRVVGILGFFLNLELAHLLEWVLRSELVLLVEEGVLLSRGLGIEWVLLLVVCGIYLLVLLEFHK